MSPYSLTAVVVGEGSLPIRCAELLLARGWAIEFVLSLDSAVVDWAKAKGLDAALVKRSGEVADHLAGLSFDCLFSIVNSLLIRENVINLAQRRAVNYHDSLLPRYAGLNAAAWAVVNGEEQHGISWHELTVGIDEGDLLVQVPVAIAAEETALTLNVKCYEAAIAGFETLVAQLEQDAETPQHQDLSQRTYFAGWARPWAGGLLDFRQDAVSLANLVRGLSFGLGYLNGLTLPKLWLGDRWVPVHTLSVLPRRTEAQPGTILAIEDKRLVVATATEDVELSGFEESQVEGLNLDTASLTVGACLPQSAQPEAIQHLAEVVARHENFWTRRLKASEGAKLDWMQTSMRSAPPQVSECRAATGFANRVGQRQWQLSDALRQGLMSLVLAGQHSEQLFSLSETEEPEVQERELQALSLGLTTVLGAYLARLSDEGCGDLAFSSRHQQAIAAQAHEAIQFETSSSERSQTASQTVSVFADGPQTSLFAKTVPLQIRPELDKPIAAALAATAKELAVLEKRGSYATDLLLRDPDLAEVQPLSVAVTWRQDPTNDDSAHRLSAIQPVPGQQLNLVIEPAQCYWLYDSEQLSEAALASLETRLISFIAGILAQPELPLCYQPLVSEQERQRVVQAWNQTEASYDWHSCVHHLFEEQAFKNPERIALEFGAERLTYGELNQRANQVAHRLRLQNVQLDGPVGVHMERSLEMIIALLGVLKAGGCYLPIDPKYPLDRRLLMVEDAQPAAILTQSRHQGELGHPCELCLDASEFWSGLSTEAPVSAVSPHNLAYIIYTSGSTGRPKGVMIEHRSLSNFAQAACQNYGVGEDDRVLQFASISFDAAAEEIYPCLISGGTLVLRTVEMMESVPQFLQCCRRDRLTILDLPTAYWHLLVAELMDETLTLPEAVRIVIIGGEAVNPQRVNQWQQMLRRTGCQAQLLNTYGPTEATVVATVQAIPQPTDVSSEETQLEPVVTIGRPLSNVSTYILDGNLQVLPEGAAGELCVGGAGLARGYLNQPEKTAAQFVESSLASGERLYKTGDLVRYLPNGEIDYLGRIDNQVKIRGFRIELGEIETHLLRQPTVEDCTVIVREDEPGQKRLVAYVVAMSGAVISQAELRQALGEKLPDYMVPVAFVALAALPMTPNEKVDRKALPRPDLSSLGGDRRASGFVAPCTATEIALARIWEKVLGVAPIGREDHFLELGGDSLTAIRLCMQIEREFGKKLLLSTLFQAPLLRELAEILRSGVVATQSCVLPLKSQGSRPPLFFVNCAQDANQIANYLGEDYRIYGLNLFGATARLCDQLDSFELSLMAQAFADDIRETQPEGPYYLSSYCGDTRLAVELAQELQRRGEDVALLALIDPWWNDDPPTLAYHWQTVRYFGMEYAVDKLKEKAHALWLKIAVLRDRWNAKLRRLAQQAPSAVDRDVELYRTYRTASALFQPQPYAGYTVLMFSEELQIDRTGQLDDVLANFTEYGYEMLSVPGYHHALFYPESLEVLGEHLRWAIDSAEKRTEQAVVLAN